MAEPSLYDLMMAADPQVEAKAMQDALRKRAALGALLQATGDKGGLGPLGADLMGSADRSGQQMAAVGGQRLRQAMEALKAQQARAEKMADRAYQEGRQELGWKEAEKRARIAAGAGTAGGGTGLKPAQFEGDVQALGKDLEPLSKALPDIDLLKKAAAKEDIAGFGPAEGLLPNLMTSDEGIANRQAAGRLMAAIIQATSGQAASEKEVARLLEANGMGRTATPAQIRQGVEKLSTQYRSLVTQREAKYHPTVVKTYGERGGAIAMPDTSEAGGVPVVPDVNARRKTRIAELKGSGKSATDIIKALEAEGLIPKNEGPVK